MKTRHSRVFKLKLMMLTWQWSKGVLNEKTVDLFQGYYGNAICGHSNDLEGMKQACWAVFYHSISTDEKPQHHCCPEGADSWCKVQRALALGQGLPPHSAKIQADLEQYIKPVFDDLCKQELLEKCLLGATQNRNESFNNLIWARAPKTEFVTRPTIEIAISQSAIIFNSGRQALLAVFTNRAWCEHRRYVHRKKSTPGWIRYQGIN